MAPYCRSHPHGPPLLGRVRVANKFPDVNAPIRPSDSLASFGRGSGSPCQRPTSGAGACSAECLGGQHVRLQTRQLRRWITGSPYHRYLPRRDRASQVTGPSSSYVPWCNTPPDSTTPRPYFSVEKIRGETVIAFTQNRTLSIRNVITFEATYPRPTRSRTYASPIPLPRPSPGSLPARAGSPLAGQVSHLQDDERNFMESSQCLQSQSTSSAWSHLCFLSLFGGTVL